MQPLHVEAIVAEVQKLHALGWCIVPCKRGLPVTRWSGETPTRRRQLHAIEMAGADGIAVVLGLASRGLCCRDFDDLLSYQRWSGEYPELAAELPTALTRRGAHVFVRSSREAFKKLPDGEFRGSRRQVVLLPPSVHRSQVVRYRWVTPPITGPGGNLRFLDPERAGLLRCWNGGDNLRLRREASQAVSLRPFCPGGGLSSRGGVEEAIARVLADSVPDGVGERNDRLFALARRCRGEAAFAGMDDEEVVHAVFPEWWSEAAGVVRTKDPRVSEQDFRVALGRVRSPAGMALATLWATAGRDLEELCRLLQVQAGPGRPFHLAVEALAAAAGRSPSWASRALRRLRDTGRLWRVHFGLRDSGRCSEFIYRPAAGTAGGEIAELAG